MAVPDALNGDGSLRRDLDWVAGLLGFPAVRKSFDVGDEILPVLLAQRAPGRHVAGLYSANQRVDQIRIEWERPGRGGPALKRSCRKVARLWVDEGGVVAVAVTERTVAIHAVPQVQAVTALFGGGQAIVLGGIAGTDPGILGERTTRDRGKEQDRVANHSALHVHSPLEREVESGEQAVAALVGAGVRRLGRFQRGELDMPRKTRAAVDEWVVPANMVGKI